MLSRAIKIFDITDRLIQFRRQQGQNGMGAIPLVFLNDGDISSQFAQDGLSFFNDFPADFIQLTLPYSWLS
ncbi:hypothetical protein ROLI_022920 [Roseobacter fucihabitans]|uniref:Uncharacterized protein n=1 Tax=Roseobacter fucihabitans TaxID=1537242 RepID=A0ABZ2BTA5_9RHOB|nr:hypothetical protein [Roseobacter litoralis]